MTERFLWSKVGTSMKIRLWFNDARGTPLLMTANGRLYAKETNKLETFCFIFKLTARWLRKYLLTWHSMRVMQLLDVPRKLSTLYRSPRVQPLSFFPHFVSTLVVYWFIRKTFPWLYYILFIIIILSTILCLTTLPSLVSLRKCSEGKKTDKMQKI